MNIKKPETAARRIGDFIVVFVLYNIFLESKLRCYILSTRSVWVNKERDLL